MLINNPIVLFDGSPFLYIHGNRSDYERSLADHIHSTMENLNSTRYVGILDGKNNFRKKVAKQKVYKGNRDKSSLLDRFPFFYRVKDLLVKKYNFKIVNGIEADDAVGIINARINSPKYVKLITESGPNKKIERVTYKSVIASIDKDLLQLNGYHYNLKKHSLEVVYDGNSSIELSVNRSSLKGKGFKFLYAQTLLGDNTDAIAGLEKCGPVKAHKLLKDCHTPLECRQKVFEAYVNYYGEEEGTKLMKEMYTLVNILTENKSLGEFDINHL